ncbi:MAG: hypothetical protein H0V07_06205 [Propionibacteriales bacterium]|nr:hypothetical protein [Propionibacteriales bacterium]
MLQRLIVHLMPSPVYLHLDRKQDRRPFNECLSSPGINEIDRRVVCWGGFSMVVATIELMRSALRDPLIDHVVLLSGSCYPIRPVGDLCEHLCSTGESELVYLPITSVETPHLAESIEHHYFHDWDARWGGRHARRAARQLCRILLARRQGLPGGLVPHFGSQWCSLSRRCAAEVVDVFDGNPELVTFYRRVLAPDEHFVQTVIANSAHARDRYLGAYRGSESFGSAALHYIQPTLAHSGPRQGPKPQWFDSPADLPALRDSGKFFVRKVRDPRIADAIDVELLSGAWCSTAREGRISRQAEIRPSPAEWTEPAQMEGSLGC